MAKNTYDPSKVIAAVKQALRDAGVEPDPDTEGYGNVKALAGAGMLLRGLGVFPAVDPEDAYKRLHEDTSWEDTDERNAREYVESTH